MAFPSKIKLPISTNRVSSHDLSCTHVTTNDFMQFSVAKALELVPRQSIQAIHSQFTRLAPMPSPTFGYADIINRAYFVPFRTVFSGWNDFITDTPHVYDNGNLVSLSSVPSFYVSALLSIFTDVSFGFVESTTNDNAKCDIIYIGTSNTPTKRNLTPLGRFAYKLLRSLGYNWSFNSNESLRKLSAMPLLCASKVYMDYYYPSAYNMDSESAWVNSYFTQNSSALQNVFSGADLSRLLKVLYRVAYESDYYTSAWDDPAGPNHGLSSDITITDPSNTSREGDTADSPLIVDNNQEGGTGIRTPQATSGGDPMTRLTQFTLTALRGLSDYMKRHQLAGSRVIDRYLSRFGITLKDAKLNRSIFIGEHRQDLQFGDVTSTSDTEGAQLGAYAGKGVSYGKGNFDFSADEYGMLIIVSIIRPKVTYYENLNRHCLHLSKTDFFTPEFDNLGVQAISQKEIYNTMDGQPVPSEDRIFGFVPRYAEYKVPFSQVTGDFLYNSKNTGMDSWFMARSLKPYINKQLGISNLIHDYDFVMGLDADQYSRIFYNTENTVDHFYVIHDFNIKSNFPGKSLYDTYEFENEGEAQNVTIPLNGTTH